MTVIGLGKYCMQYIKLKVYKWNQKPLCKKSSFSLNFFSDESNRHNAGKEEILVSIFSERDTVFPIHPTICHVMT